MSRKKISRKRLISKRRVKKTIPYYYFKKSLKKKKIQSKNIYKYSVDLFTSDQYSSENVIISGMLEASSEKEALEKINPFVISNFDEIYRKIKSIDAFIIYVNDDERTETLEEKTVVLKKILNEIESKLEKIILDEDEIFKLETTGKGY